MKKLLAILALAPALVSAQNPQTLPGCAVGWAGIRSEANGLQFTVSAVSGPLAGRQYYRDYTSCGETNFPGSYAAASWRDGSMSLECILSDGYLTVRGSYSHFPGVFSQLDSGVGYYIWCPTDGERAK